MAKINILDKHIAELIAAGEVVERPSSVVKELCENSVDAGATSIVVLIEKGGIQKIEIRDNGCGIEPEYMKNAFISHATSKISSKDDLDKIATLGFRGEALASIASVAHVSLISKTDENEFAYEYIIEGGEEVSFAESARPQGTTICVTNIFYNTPARMKFLKKDSSEASFITDIVSKLALSHPQISFKLIKDGKEVFFTPGDGNLLNTIHEVLSRDFGKDLLNINYCENNISVKGYVTLPRLARASRSMQYFFINGRYVKTRTALAALENAYRGLLMGGRFPGCVLFIEMPYELVDVNVHPSKIEVRFANESEVFNSIYRSVKMALANPVTTEKHLDFKSELQIPQKKEATTIPQVFKSDKEDIQESKIDNIANEIKNTYYNDKPIFNTGYDKNPTIDILCSESVPITYIEPKKEVVENTSQYVISEQITKQTEKKENDVVIEESTNVKEELEYIGEVFKTYIIAKQGEVMCFIDKHAAHERILYDKLRNNYENVPSQQLLMPVNILLSANEKNALMDNVETLDKFGFEIEDFGGNAVLVRAIPTEIKDDDCENLILELAQKFLQNIKKPLTDKTQWILSSISCRAAIKAGDKSTNIELLNLATRVLSGEISMFCPHGRPIVLKITQKELEKQFGRLG